MNRRNFIGCAAKITTCCGAAWSLAKLEKTAEAAQPQAPSTPQTSGTPAAKRLEQGKKVIKRIMDQMDLMLDLETRRNFMMACGHACFVGAYGPNPVTPPSSEKVAAFLDHLKKQFGPDAVKTVGSETVIDYAFRQSPFTGLRTADGYCLCEFVEDGPRDLSSTYCLCSLGYVKEMFRRQLGRPVKVELIHSVRRGDRECRFTIKY